MANSVALIPHGRRPAIGSPRASGRGSERTAEASMLAGPSTRRRWLVILSFWFLVFATVFNFNAIAVRMTGKVQAFSYMLLALCLIVILRQIHRMNRDLGRLGWVFVAFLASYVALGYVNPERIQFQWVQRDRTISAILMIVAAALGAAHAAEVFKLHTIFRTFLWICMAATLMIFIAERLPWLFHVVRASDDGRETGTGLTPVSSGHVAVITVVLAFACLANARYWFVYVACIVVASIAVVMTMSRAPLLELFAVLLVQAKFGPRARRKTILFIVFLMSIAAFWFVMYGADSIPGLSPNQRFRIASVRRIITLQFDNEDATGRLVLNKMALHYISRRPIFGNGLGFMVPMPGTHMFAPGGLGPHNVLFMVWGDSGLIPAILYLVCLGMFGWYAWRCPSQTIRTVAISYLSMVLIMTVTEHSMLLLREQNVTLGICIALLIACHRAQARIVSQARGRRVPVRMVSMPQRAAVAHGTS